MTVDREMIVAAVDRKSEVLEALDDIVPAREATVPHARRHPCIELLDEFLPLS